MVVIRQQNYSTERQQGLRCTGITHAVDKVTFAIGTLVKQAIQCIQCIFESFNENTLLSPMSQYEGSKDLNLL